MTDEAPSESEEIRLLRRMVLQQNPATVHLRPPRAAETLCGLAAKSARTTGKLSCATCEACLDALRAAVRRREEQREQRALEQLQRTGELPDGWALTPVALPEAAPEEPPPADLSLKP